MCWCLSQKLEQLECARFQFHVIDHKAAAFHVQYLHAGATAVDEDVYIPILHVSPHQVGHHPAEGVKAAAHIGRLRVQVVLHCRSEAEHINRALKPTVAPEPRDLTDTMVNSK